MSDAIFGLEGKNAVVLGGGQGMGESTAMFLAQVGCNVAVLDMDMGRAETVAKKVQALGRRSIPIQFDATNDAQVQSAIARADTELGGIDGMASIIGMAGWQSALEMTPEMWDTDQKRNLRYFFFAAQAVAKAMVKRGRPGSIVCITSIDGIRSAPYHASYGAAKAGLINLVKSLSVEFAQHAIRINAVAPGTIITPRIPKGEPEYEKLKAGGTPMQRRGTTDEIGKAVLFFLSDMATFVTGQTLAVDGGYTAAPLLDYAAIARIKNGGEIPGIASPTLRG